MSEDIQSLPGEIWKPVVGYEGLYEVSNLGRVKSLTRHVPHGRFGTHLVRQRIVKSRDSYGYRRAGLARDRSVRKMSIHRLVLEAFVGPCPEGMEACHNNGVRDDNRLDNLRWDTRKNNHADMRLHGTAPVGEKSPWAKLSRERVVVIKRQLCAGVKCGVIAAGLDVSVSTIYDIKMGRSWRHV